MIRLRPVAWRKAAPFACYRGADSGPRSAGGSLDTTRGGEAEGIGGRCRRGKEGPRSPAVLYPLRSAQPPVLAGHTRSDARLLRCRTAECSCGSATTRSSGRASSRQPRRTSRYRDVCQWRLRCPTPLVALSAGAAVRCDATSVSGATATAPSDETASPRHVAARSGTPEIAAYCVKWMARHGREHPPHV